MTRTTGRLTTPPAITVPLVFESDVPLAALTTLGLGGPARRFARVTSVEDLRTALADGARHGERVLILGGGSNLVVADAGFEGLVIAMAITGVAIDGNLVTVGAGESWDGLVAQTVAANLAGFECLSGIPGSVGATPMQNVGAYGQEVSDTIVWVEALDRDTGALRIIKAAECDFAYRASRFRGSDRWAITRVRFELTAGPDSRPIRYAELAKALGIPDGEVAPLAQVRETVLALRRGKGMVVDASDPDSRSAGSFFTNPLVDPTTFADLRERVGEGVTIPAWPADHGRTKLSAGWLIERAGFARGHVAGPVGISNKHALALVHRGGGTTRELLELAATIQDAVRTRLGVELHPEPVFV